MTLIALIVYLALVVPAAINNVERINPDGICYISLARNLAEGRAVDSVSSWWSPLITWCIAPLLGAGIDGLAAARIVLAAWGVVLLVGTIALTRRLTNLRDFWLLLPVLVIVLVAVDRAIQEITPDIIVAACLMLYFTATLHPRLFDSRWRQLSCGLLGGVAFLAKAYALPFVFVHFALILLLRSWLDPADKSDAAEQGTSSPRFRALLKAWGVGMIGLALVAAPWIGVISFKDGGLTITSAGRGTHARKMHVRWAPDARRWPPEDRLRAPMPGHSFSWETPHAYASDPGPPGQSAPFLANQVQVIRAGVRKAGWVISRLDRLSLSFYLVLALPLLAFFLRSRRDDLFRCLWLLGTVGFYCSGYALILVKERFMVPVLLPPICILCFHFASVLAARASAWRKPVGIAVACVTAAVVALSFGHMAVKQIEWNRTMSGHTIRHRSIARQILANGLTGPMASTDYWDGLYIAYHFGGTYLGTPATGDLAECEADVLAECEAELDAHGVRVFLVWSNSPLRAVFAKSPSWRRIITDTRPDTRSPLILDVYVRRPAGGGT